MLNSITCATNVYNWRAGNSRQQLESIFRKGDRKLPIYLDDEYDFETNHFDPYN